MSNHKPITEAELKEMEHLYPLVPCRACGDSGEMIVRLIAEVRRQRVALTSYAEASNWTWQSGDMATDAKDTFCPPHPDYRHADGYKLAREAIGWDPPDEPCDNPSCDGVKDDITYGARHRCFKDGCWLDDGSEM